MRNKSVLWLAAVLAAFGSGANAATAPTAGHFQFTSGDVRLVQVDGTQRPASKGEAVSEGETVVTGPNSSAQLLMVDDAIVALRPNSSLNVSVYQYAAQHGKESAHVGRGVLDLIQGGFRAITGAIGHVNKKDFLIKTENATIGIRGTDHEPMYIPAAAPGEAPLGTPGTYDKVNTGGTYIQDAAGRVDVSPNQVGFASLEPGVEPVLLKSVPQFMLPTPPVREGRRDRGETAEEKSDLGWSLPGASRPVLLKDAYAPTSIVGEVMAPGTTGTMTNGALTEVSLLVAPQLPAPSIDYAAVAGDVGTTDAYNAAFVVTNKESDNFFSTSTNSALVSPASVDNYKYSGGKQLASGSATLPGTTVAVNWGIYAGGHVQDGPGAPRKVDYFQAMTGPETPQAIVASLSGTYSKVVASAMVTAGGVTGGTLNSANIAVTNGNLTGYSIALTDGASRGWAAACSSCGGAGVPLAAFKSAGVSLQGIGPTPMATGQANGMPIGSAGQGMLSSFALHDGYNAVTGSFAAQK